ncbi:hypothetical protein BC829DRAFT_415329 [Chytridium lagenaria]|nr:hypothetical protein BC829DRAFT_415329 [Chytridium lagenaria]
MAEVGIVVNWDDPSLWAKQCYPLLGPMQLGGAGQQNAFVKEGAAVTISGATSVPFPAPPSASLLHLRLHLRQRQSPPPSFPQQSPPAAEPHSADPNQPHEASSIAASITDQPSVILPEDSTDPLTRASSIISGGRTLTGVVVSASNATGTINGILGPDSTSRSNGFSGSSVGDTSNNGNASSSISSTAIIGIASVAAALVLLAPSRCYIPATQEAEDRRLRYEKTSLFLRSYLFPLPESIRWSYFEQRTASLGPGQAGVPNATGSTSVFVKTAAMKSTAPSSGFQGPVAVAMPSRSYTENPEKPEKQPSPTVQLGSKTQSQVPNRTAASTKPPYAPLAADTKVPFLHTQTPLSWRRLFLRQPLSPLACRQRAHNCINGNDIWDMDAYRVSLLGLKASSADVINLLREIQNLRNDTALSNRLTLPTYQN